MAWKEIKVCDARKQFIEAYLENKLSITELCRQFDISRKNGYKWIERYNNESWEGLQDRSRAPVNQTQITLPLIENQILDVRFKYPTWGPKKVKAFLEIEQPDLQWPSSTTIGNIFSRNGLITPRKLRKRLPVRTSPLADSLQCNDTWCFDFKGWFLTSDKLKCDPFTLTDAYSRYLFSCTKLRSNNTEHVWAILDRCFREYGLPLRVRSDNGPPFATTGIGRLSQLSVKLIKAGILPEWIDPGEPQQNGRHERMHLTVQQESVFPGILSLSEQQVKFNQFIEYYNFVRPHEGVGQKRPGDIYQPSTRLWTGRLQSPEYSNEHKVGRVKSCGKMSWKGREIYVGRVLSGEPVGIKKDEEGSLTMHYGQILLGNIVDGELRFERRKQRIRR